jgi:hypothetical protein
MSYRQSFVIQRPGFLTDGRTLQRAVGWWPNWIVSGCEHAKHLDDPAGPRATAPRRELWKIRRLFNLKLDEGDKGFGGFSLHVTAR